MFYTSVMLDIIAGEVKRQEAGPEFVPGLCKALDYGWTVRKALGENFRVSNHDVFCMLALINRRERTGGYRYTPVTFRNGGSSANAQEIPRLMRNVLPQFKVSNDESFHRDLVKEVLWIHPDTDGNGRLGFVLYNLFSRRMQVDHNDILMWIEAMPEFDWMPS